jgi:trehalose 6-phosphate phosphatase
VALYSFDLKTSAILLDVDGTILDIAPTRHDVHVPESLLHALSRVGELAGGALALVSGRPIKDLDSIFSPLRLPVIGGHGAEIRLLQNGGAPHRPATSLDPALKMQLQEIAARYSGVSIEDKGYSVALHYRLALEHEIDVVNDVFRLCKQYQPASFELLTGKAVIEVKAVGYSKGTAVRELMKHPPFAGRIPIFIGDDITDEAAFAVMPEFRGVAISVGRRVPGILGAFRSPSEVRQWLETLCNNVAA